MTLPDLTNVWSPLTIGGTTVKNRILATAHALVYGEDHLLSDRHIAYYRERARGGVALLITEQHAAHPITRGTSIRYCSAWDTRCIPQLAKLADTVHEHGCKQFVQLYAAGVHDKGTASEPWHPVWGASRVPSVVYNEIPYVMGPEEVRDVVEAHAQAGKNVHLAGLDGVEIHGAHSWLVGQFLSPFYNRRTDRYGGSARKRCQLAIEIAEAIRATTYPDFTVGLRYSFDEFMGDAGITPEQAEEQLDVLASSGLFDFFDISGGSYHSFEMIVPGMGQTDGYMIPFGKQAKEIVGDRAKIFVVGRIRDLDLAARALGDRAADMVGMTRALIADPYLVDKTREGRREEIIRCIGANECIFRNFQQLDVRCVVNPVTGREQDWREGQLERVGLQDRRRIIVVGGGPAGMKLAEIAGARGHRVTLMEREDRLGGHLNLFKGLPRRGDWGMAIEDMERRLVKADVDVRLGLDVTAAILEGESADAVVCATGSQWDCTGFSAMRPGRESIPGAEQENVLDVGTATRRALVDPNSLGSKILILDETGDYLPLGLAELLTTTGNTVEVITWRSFVGENLHAAFEAGHVLRRLAASGIRMAGYRFIESINGKTVEVYETWGQGRWFMTDVDSVVLALLRTPEDRLFFDIRDRFPAVFRIGDALAPRRTLVAIHEGEELGRRI
jgi:2,4-dienoyl-CoA reductase-like NADH-dependent reductase (Old Yellow Enzyme family)